MKEIHKKRNNYRYEGKEKVPGAIGDEDVGENEAAIVEIRAEVGEVGAAIDHRIAHRKTILSDKDLILY